MNIYNSTMKDLTLVLGLRRLCGCFVLAGCRIQHFLVWFKFDHSPSSSIPCLLNTKLTTVLFLSLFLWKVFMLFNSLNSLSTVTLEKGKTISICMTFVKLLQMGCPAGSLRSATFLQYSSGYRLHVLIHCVGKPF